MAAIRKVVRLGEGGAVSQVVVRELTVGEFRAWLAQATRSEERDALTCLLLDKVDVRELTHFSDLTEADIEHLTPSELQLVWAAAQEVNPDFFALLGRLAGQDTPAVVPS